jgi:4-hydroxymandelate oxidase
METSLQTLADYRRAARARLPQMAWDYFRSGADGGETLRENRRAYRRWQFWPRMLVDVSTRDLGTEILGARLSMPIAIAPTAYQRLAHPDGEVAMARAAAGAGTLLCAATLATTTLEDVAAAASGPCWFQLYVHRDRGLVRELIERAQKAGYGALVITVDTPVLGRRLADERNGFRLPPSLRMANFPDGQMTFKEDGSALNHYFAARHDAALSWRDLDWIRSLTTLPIILKGILRSDDAARAAASGCEGIMVSNHGGRQLDGVPATLDALPGVVAAVAGTRTVVMFDGGVRSGGDVLKALALGARLVLVGRPLLWGLAVAGEAGARHVLELLRAELDRAMTLAGCPSLAAIDRDLVRARSP